MASAFLHSVCNSAGPQRFCHIAACSAWVPVTVLDRSDQEVEPSLPVLPWPHRGSVIPLYSVTSVTARVKSATIRILNGAQSATDECVETARSRRCPPRFGWTGTAGDLPKSRVLDCGPISHSQQGAVVDHARGRGVFFADLDLRCQFGGRVAAGIPTGDMAGRQPR